MGEALRLRELLRRLTQAEIRFASEMTKRR
jgi:hypothetical protein